MNDLPMMFKTNRMNNSLMVVQWCQTFCKPRKLVHLNSRRFHLVIGKNGESAASDGSDREREEKREREALSNERPPFTSSRSVFKIGRRCFCNLSLSPTVGLLVLNTSGRISSMIAESNERHSCGSSHV